MFFWKLTPYMSQSPHKNFETMEIVSLICWSTNNSWKFCLCCL